MKLHLLENENSLLNVFISEIRDEIIQKDSLRFRKNMERVGEIITYELSKKLSYSLKQISTPLGKKEIAVLNDSIVICSVLRAGLTIHQGVLNYFDRAESGFVSAFRKEIDNEVIKVVVNYVAAPSLNGKVLLLVDPMIATGTTLENVLHVLTDFGQPKEIHIVAAIGSKKGIEKVTKAFPKETNLWIAAIDATLNKKSYIVPGLGDVGDLAFGNKIKP
jgi:uracil phosphoribosyltransferase